MQWSSRYSSFTALPKWTSTSSPSHCCAGQFRHLCTIHSKSLQVHPNSSNYLRMEQCSNNAVSPTATTYAPVCNDDTQVTRPNPPTSCDQHWQIRNCFWVHFRCSLSPATPGKFAHSTNVFRSSTKYLYIATSLLVCKKKSAWPTYNPPPPSVPLGTGI